ncbi:hypothetical protein M0G43_12545 [Subsaxibacter sp. CAU 1640]|uniref:YobI family P-loop NTPase n=1 Tax=Subsaxibacter sp. CAU 1640 TaxID=2933271 RepID=UPI0020051DC7|nr:hypothetical protein [Subsaxibacter sp. CAU 1640]MCK7591407.1 hypothetical protein [Subsaxibacter sp. CAU 1640]
MLREYSNKKEPSKKVDKIKDKIADNKNDESVEKSDTSVKVKLDLLTPLDIKDDARIKKYIEHIYNAVDNPNIKNLALTGVYGSGKSTIIKSFKSQYSKLKVLHITLASFNEAVEYDKFQDKIQLAILQQILYSQSSEKLPESRINRIREIDVWNKKHFLKVLLLLVFIISLFSLLNYYTLQLNPNNWNADSSFSIGCILNLFLFLLSSFLIGQFLFKMIANSKINKINVKGEAELGSKIENKDFLNKHLDEILYFFEKIPTDIVVIEDLDRFNSTEIYRTLREINFILNNYLKNTKKEYRKVTFLYAIKDDLFSNEIDRTKFFDQIIPTIPYVNYSNAKNVLTNKLNEIYGDENNLFNKSNSGKDLINGVSTFITDNRILINIMNEFTIFKEQQKLQNEEFNQEKLLAIIVYKNLRPKDFSNLHTGKSNIDIVFSNKWKFTNLLENDLKDDIRINNESITKIRQHNVKSISNLNTLFLYHIKDLIGNNSARGLVIQSENKKFKEIIDKSIDLNTLYTEEIFWYQSANAKYSIHIKLDEVDKLVGYKYSDSYNVIFNENELIKNRETEIDKLRTSINDLKNETLSQILKKKYLSKENLISDFEDYYQDREEIVPFYDDSLLMFLLENGHIDEHYREYISTFQKGGLTPSDYEFKVNIFSTTNEPKTFDYKLYNIIDVVEELSNNYFQDSRILNVSLMDFLLVNKENHKTKFKTLIETISKWDSRSRLFFIHYINNGGGVDLFIEEMAKSWKDLWNKIESDSNVLDKDKRHLLFLLLENLNIEFLKSINYKMNLSKHIANDIEFYYQFNNNENSEKVKKILSAKGLNIKFKQIDARGWEEKKFTLLYENDRYILNSSNVKAILAYQLKDTFDINAYEDFNLSYIYNTGLNDLILYIEEDSYNTYILNIYSKLTNIQYEDENRILDVLNKDGLLESNALLFLEKQGSKIKDLYKLNDERYDIAFEKNVMESNWYNVFWYFRERDNSFNEILNQFLNTEDNYLSLEMDKKYDFIIKSEEKNKFIFNLISNNSLKLEVYEELIKVFKSAYKIPEKFDFKSLDDDKVKTLIDLNYVEVSKTNFDSIKESYSPLNVDLLIKNVDSYTDFIEEYGLDLEDTIYILQHQDLSDKQKIKLLNLITVEEINDSLELAEEMCQLMIRTQNSSLVKEKLEILLKQDLEIEQKANLILLYEEKLEKLKIVEIFKQSFPKSYRIAPHSQISLIDNEYNMKLVELLQRKRIAGKYDKSRRSKIKKIRVYTLKF